MFKVLKKPNSNELDVEYKIVKGGMLSQIGSKDSDALIFAFTKAKDSMSVMNILAWMLIVFGGLLSIILVGIMPLIGGLFLLRVVKNHKNKFNYFIEKAKNDPELIHG